MNAMIKNYGMYGITAELAIGRNISDAESIHYFPKMKPPTPKVSAGAARSGFGESGGELNHGISGPGIDSLFTNNGILPKTGLTIVRRILPIVANAEVDASVAQKILGNYINGRPVWDPSQGRVGGVSWFVSEGNPYTGTSGNKIPIDVEIRGISDPLVFQSSDLVDIFNQKMDERIQQKTSTYKQSGNSPSPAKINEWKSDPRIRNSVQRAMWEEIGKRVKDSASKTGEVILQNSEFSTNGETPPAFRNGKFTVVAEGSKASITLKGGAQGLLKALEAEPSFKADPALEQAGKDAVAKYKAGQSVRAVFNIGGKIFLAIGATNDAISFIEAKNKAKEASRIIGGWSGAAAGASAFSALYWPADSAGPIAWALHGLGALASGAAGYAGGSWAGEKAYDLVFE